MSTSQEMHDGLWIWISKADVGSACRFVSVRWRERHRAAGHGHPRPSRRYYQGGYGVLTVDGKEVARKSMEHTIPFLRPADESFDVGVDTRTPVDFTYDVPFRFTGTIDKLTINLGKSQLSAEDQKKMDDAVARVNN